MKVIAAIDIMDGNVVRLIKGDAATKIIYSDDIVETAKKWEAAGADMLHVVDLNAAFSTGSNFELISKIADSVTIPIQAAGGIRTREAAEKMLTKATKIVIGTMAYSDPEIVKKIAKKNVGRLVISIDQKGGVVMVKGWKESTGVKVENAISKFMAMGIEEFLLTSVERDGMLEGPDLQTLSVAVKSGARIIASGGIARIEDVIKLRSAGCSSVILGKAMYDQKVSIGRAKMIA